MLGLGLDIPTVAVLGRPGDASVNSLIGRMTTAPDAGRAALIDQTVRALKQGGVWGKLTCLWLGAAHDQQAARLNWISSSYDWVENGTLTFTADRGYTGDGSTGYLSTGWNATLAAQDSLAIGGWVLTNIAGTGICGSAPVPNLIVNPRNASDLMTARVNSPTNGPVPGHTDSRGLMMVDRSAGTTTTYYRNGVAAGGNSNPSQTPESSELQFLSYSAGPAVFATHQVAAGAVAATLDASEHAALHAALAAFLAGVGAV